MLSLLWLLLYLLARFFPLEPLLEPFLSDVISLTTGVRSPPVTLSSGTCNFWMIGYLGCSFSSSYRIVGLCFFLLCSESFIFRFISCYFSISILSFLTLSSSCSCFFLNSSSMTLFCSSYLSCPFFLSCWLSSMSICSMILGRDCCYCYVLLLLSIVNCCFGC